MIQEDMAILIKGQEKDLTLKHHWKELQNYCLRKKLHLKIEFSNKKIDLGILIIFQTNKIEQLKRLLINALFQIECFFAYQYKGNNPEASALTKLMLSWKFYRYIRREVNYKLPILSILYLLFLHFYQYYKYV